VVDQAAVSTTASPVTLTADVAVNSAVMTDGGVDGERASGVSSSRVPTTVATT
jgi:hypothetical protein